MKAELYADLFAKRAEEGTRFSMRHCSSAEVMSMSMGLAPGGLMRQHIYKDPYGLAAWDMTAPSRCFVHIMNSTQWLAATDSAPPNPPPTAAEYTKAGLPWFDYYAGDLAALEGAKPLAGLDSVAAKAVKKGEPPLPGNDPVAPGLVVKLGRPRVWVGSGAW